MPTLRARSSREPLEKRQFVSVYAAADYAGISVDTIRRRIRSGHLTKYRIGHQIVRVDLAEVEAMMRDEGDRAAG